jgi:3-oxoacyl-[acyl-carrier-protein] synthase III
MSLRLESIRVHFPEKAISNEELGEKFGADPVQIFKNTGIRRRYATAPDETPSDLAVIAAEDLFTRMGLAKNEVDFIIFCSEGFDHKAPATACLIQHRLGLPTSVGAMDLPYGCSGYVYGLGLAHALLVSGMSRTVLFLTGDAPTTVIHRNDLELQSIFSDIGSATLVRHSEGPQHFIFGTDGGGYENLIVRHSAARNAHTPETFADTQLPKGYMTMNSTEVFLFAVKTVPKLVTQLLERYACSLDEVDLFVFHQASYFMLDVIRRKCGIPKEKFFINIEQVGNSVSSSIPVALREAEDTGVLKRGMKVMLAGFGIGYSWAGTIITY